MKLWAFLREFKYAYQAGNVFNFLWVRPPQFLIRFLDYFLVLFQKRKHEKSEEKLLYNWKIALLFIIDLRYQDWICSFIDFLLREKGFSISTWEIAPTLRLYVWDSRSLLGKKADIFIDLADDQQIHESYYDQVRYYIKRELSSLNAQREKMLPMPYLFSLNAQKTQEAQAQLRMQTKEINWEDYYLSFGWRSLDSQRQERLAKLKNALWEKMHHYAASFHKHIATLNQSKYWLNLFGGGEYCHRFTEIANSDTLMVSQRYTIEIPNNFTDMENIVYFDTLSELMQKLELLDQDPALYAKIKTNFQKHYQQYHSHQVYVQRLRNQITQLIS